MTGSPVARLFVALGTAGVLAVAVGAFIYYVLPPAWGWGVAGLLFLFMLISGLVMADRQRRWKPKTGQRVFVDLGIEGEARGRVVQHHPSPTVPQTTVNFGAGPIRVGTSTLTHRTPGAHIERFFRTIAALIP